MFFIRIVVSAINQPSPVQKHPASLKKKQAELYFFKRRNNNCWVGRNVLRNDCVKVSKFQLSNILYVPEAVQDLLLEKIGEKINKSISVSSALLAYIYI